MIIFVVALPKAHVHRNPLRRLPVGAEVILGRGVHFRVWAPECRSVEIVVGAAEREALPLKSEDNGYFSVLAPAARAGTLYRYRLDGGAAAWPDLASRFQPEGPLGPSQVIDPTAFEWTDAAWPGVKLRGQVLYEMHIGTFTPEGTWSSAAALLPELADIGITLIELMPVAEFAGKFGWSYDGVGLFAPTHLYGAPDDLRRFVDRAHAVNIGVILDVVYSRRTRGSSGRRLRGVLGWTRRGTTISSTPRWCG